MNGTLFDEDRDSSNSSIQLSPEKRVLIAELPEAVRLFRCSKQVPVSLSSAKFKLSATVNKSVESLLKTDFKDVERVLSVKQAKRRYVWQRQISRIWKRNQSLDTPRESGLVGLIHLLREADRSSTAGPHTSAGLEARGNARAAHTYLMLHVTVGGLLVGGASIHSSHLPHPSIARALRRGTAEEPLPAMRKQDVENAAPYAELHPAKAEDTKEGYRLHVLGSTPTVAPREGGKAKSWGLSGREGVLVATPGFGLRRDVDLPKIGKIGIQLYTQRRQCSETLSLGAGSRPTRPTPLAHHTALSTKHRPKKVESGSAKRATMHFRWRAKLGRLATTLDLGLVYATPAPLDLANPSHRSYPRGVSHFNVCFRLSVLTARTLQKEIDLQSSTDTIHGGQDAKMYDAMSALVRFIDDGAT
ncbi:hypothetical protein B0H12DRAFT_1072540 [Mycena haematopus]|nr:hypothetical protein B0H12DRAFT_1072540 [Mycena haematopus]